MKTGLTPWQVQNSNLAPGTTNDRISQMVAERKAHEEMLRGLEYFPEPETARRDVERAAEKLATVEAKHVERKRDHVAAKAISDAAAAELHGLDLQIRAADQNVVDADAAYARSVRDKTAIMVDPDAAVVARQCLARQRPILAQKHEELVAVTKAAAQRLEVATHAVAEARFSVAKAKLAAAASVALVKLLDELGPLLDGVDQAMHGSTQQAALREARQVREKIARTLAPLLPEELVRLVGARAARRAAPAAPLTEETGVVMYVKPGENFGGNQAGSRVVVSEADLGSRAIASCLETEEEYAQRKWAAGESNARPKAQVPETVEIVEAALKKATEQAIAARAQS